MLIAKQLRKSYGHLEAVNNLSFEIHEGEIFGLLGPYRAGKTTTISVVTGLLRPDSGKVAIGSQGRSGDPQTPSIRRMIGVAQLSPFQILAEKALACFIGVTGMLTLFGHGPRDASCQLHGVGACGHLDRTLFRRTDDDVSRTRWKRTVRQRNRVGCQHGDGRDDLTLTDPVWDRRDRIHHRRSSSQPENLTMQFSQADHRGPDTCWLNIASSQDPTGPPTHQFPL